MYTTIFRVFILSAMLCVSLYGQTDVELNCYDTCKFSDGFNGYTVTEDNKCICQSDSLKFDVSVPQSDTYPLPVKVDVIPDSEQTGVN